MYVPSQRPRPRRQRFRQSSPAVSVCLTAGGPCLTLSAFIWLDYPAKDCNNLTPVAITPVRTSPSLRVDLVNLNAVSGSFCFRTTRLHIHDDHLCRRPTF
jgi:hypothetical protein